MKPHSVIRPVILCGGDGQRLWPVSRKSMPKQFATFGSQLSLLQHTIQRFEDAGCGAPIFMTHEDYRFIVAEQAHAMGISSPQIVIEPNARNTGPSVFAASEVLLRDDPDALMLVTPADHRMDGDLDFANAVAIAAKKARLGHIVTFGAHPTSAQPDYGYIRVGGTVEDLEILPFTSFIEKPTQDEANTLFDSGNCLWNTGIFMTSVTTMQKTFSECAPDLVSSVRTAFEAVKPDMDFLRLGQVFNNAPNISVDHAILENAQGWCVALKGKWLDLSDWKNVWDDMTQDAHGVATHGQARAVDCANSLLFSGSSGVEVVGIGLKNIAAVATKDAVLIADLDDARSVSNVVAKLAVENIPQATEFPRHARPWGHYETLSLGGRFQVKSIVVKPGGKLSLQSHVHRAEHWVVVEGTATVTIGHKQSLIGENQSVYIPLGEVHRLENSGKVPLQLIEVQTGTYLGEDDIVRYEDVYERS